MGSRLLEMEAELVAELEGSSWSVFCFDTVASTMDTARELMADSEAAAPFIVLARSQSAGRGRLGRSWEESSGALYATLVTETSIPLAGLSGFSLLVGLTLGKVIESLGGRILLKWPNDILSLEYRKCSGILIELVSKAGTHSVLTGIGMNLVDVPGGAPDAVSLREITGKNVTSKCLLSEFVKAFEPNWALFLREGFEPFREEWSTKAAYLGETITLEVGGELVTGCCDGVNARGELLLTVSGEQREIVAGHLCEMIMQVLEVSPT